MSDGVWVIAADLSGHKVYLSAGVGEDKEDWEDDLEMVTLVFDDEPKAGRYLTTVSGCFGLSGARVERVWPAWSTR